MWPLHSLTRKLPLYHFFFSNVDYTVLWQLCCLRLPLASAVVGPFQKREWDSLNKIFFEHVCDPSRDSYLFISYKKSACYTCFLQPLQSEKAVMDSVICFMSKCDYTSSCMFQLWLNRPVSTQILPSVICVFCAYESCRGPGEGLVVVLCISCLHHLCT